MTTFREVSMRTSIDSLRKFRMLKLLFSARTNLTSMHLSVPWRKNNIKIRLDRWLRCPFASGTQALGDENLRDVGTDTDKVTILTRMTLQDAVHALLEEFDGILEKDAAEMSGWLDYIQERLCWLPQPWNEGMTNPYCESLEPVWTSELLGYGPSGPLMGTKSTDK